jgi:ankyrin repeat protein
MRNLKAGGQLCSAQRRRGIFEICRALRKAGAGLGVEDVSEEGYTALHIVARGNHCVVMRWLLQEGVDTKLRDKGGKTALEYAEEGGQGTIAGILRRS